MKIDSTYIPQVRETPISNRVFFQLMVAALAAGFIAMIVFNFLNF